MTTLNIALCIAAGIVISNLGYWPAYRKGLEKLVFYFNIKLVASMVIFLAIGMGYFTPGASEKMLSQLTFLGITWLSSFATTLFLFLFFVPTSKSPTTPEQPEL